MSLMAAAFSSAAANPPVVSLAYAAQSIGAGWSTISGSATFSTVAGDAMVVEFTGLANASQGDPTISNGATLVKQTAAFNAFSSSATTYGGFYLVQNPTTGSHTVTPPTVTGGNDGLIMVWKITNMPATITVRTAGKVAQGTSSQSLTVTTAGNVSANDLAFGYRSSENSVGSTSAITQPGGWTSDAQYLNGSLNLPTDWSHFKVVSGGAPLSGTWTSTDTAITDTSGAILVLSPT